MKSCLHISRILLLCIAVAISFRAGAQNRIDSTVVHKFLISYPVNVTVLHDDYQNNHINLRTIKEYFQKSPRIDSIVIYSYASPEGPYNWNVYLAKERGERARRYLLEQLKDREFPASRIIVNYTPENWTGLYEMVNTTYPYEDKPDVLNLLEREDISDDERKELLKKLNGGRPWEFIRDEILPELRYATWVAEWADAPEIIGSLPGLPSLQSSLTAYSPGISFQREIVTPEAKKVILALKTNLLYDALSFVNFSIEAPIYKDKLSILYYHQFPWWTWGQASNEYCDRFLSIGGEVRWWFKTRDILQGHFLGAYAESGKYDFEYQRSICYQGEFYTTGLSYGYAMPIGKNLNLEFSLSAGYASFAYRGYTPTDDYELLIRDRSNVGRLHYIGPTKAQVSLVIPIKAKIRKGGER